MVRVTTASLDSISVVGVRGARLAAFLLTRSETSFSESDVDVSVPAQLRLLRTCDSLNSFCIKCYSYSAPTPKDLFFHPSSIKAQSQLLHVCTSLPPDSVTGPSSPSPESPSELRTGIFQFSCKLRSHAFVANTLRERFGKRILHSLHHLMELAISSFCLATWSFWIMSLYLNLLRRNLVFLFQFIDCVSLFWFSDELELDSDSDASACGQGTLACGPLL